ncbi:MAG: exo-alpha-sialidase, partial [Fulvivirga sp.]|uniref:exo-alpha-sialidase n=1 Tax=Fulvivirga sp. TaxID=1931237 RepID=UPI0032EBB889
MNRFALLLMVFSFFFKGCSLNNSNSDKNEMIISLPVEVGKNHLPYLFQDLEQNVYLSWVETIETDTSEQSVFKYAKLLEDKSWSTPKLISGGTNWFVNWADYPMIATFKGEKIIAHFLVKSSEGTYSYDIAIKTSQNYGKSWSESTLIHDDGKEAEHGFVSMVPYGDNYFIAWLDGRSTSMVEGHYGEMTIRAAVVSPTGNKIQEWQLDDRVCDCCQTAAAITDNGPVVIYRNRSEEEIRDIYITRFVNDIWTKPVAIYNDNWEIMGCPVNGPQIAAEGNNLVIAWFTASQDAQVKLIFSEDGGSTFSKPIRV